eukprot:6190627-Pleurochrysis_carterae.AAC.7
MLALFCHSRTSSAICITAFSCASHSCDWGRWSWQYLLLLSAHCAHSGYASIRTRELTAQSCKSF